MSTEPTDQVNQSEKEAKKLLTEDTARLANFLDNAGKKVNTQKERLETIWFEIETLIKLVRAYTSGEYTKIPWKAIVMALGAIIYFVNPLDIVPDFFVPFGFVDDATVIGFVVKALREEITQFSDYLTNVNKEQKAVSLTETSAVNETDQ